MDRMSSILQWRLLKFNCCLLCFQAAVFCYFLFSKRHFVLRASSSDELINCWGSHIPTHIFIYILAFVSAPQTMPRTANMCGNTILLYPTRWSWRSNKSHEISFIGWNSCMHRIFFFYVKQGKVGSSIQPIHGTFSINKFYKFGRHVCRHFTVWSRARLWRGVWKLAPSRDFRNQRARGQKTIGSHLKMGYFTGCALKVWIALIQN